MRRGLLALMVLLALAGAWLWLAPQARGPRPAPHGEAASVDPTSKAPDLAVVPEVEPAPSAPVAGAVAPAPAAPTAAAREESPNVLEAELARAQWVEGRVLFPPGTPSDEEAIVVARGKAFSDGRSQRARVGPDGRFRVAFTEDTRTGWFRLEARMPYLDPDVPWKRGGAEPVLEAMLGARIAGHLQVPAGTATAAAVGGTVRLQQKTGAARWQETDERPVGADLAFAFDAVVPVGEARLGYDGEAFVGRSTAQSLEAGRTVWFELVLEAGVVLAGVVRDESGAPLPGVEVEARMGGPSPWPTGQPRNAETRADGRFRLGALAPGMVELRAERDQFLPLRRLLGEQPSGAELLDLELVLGRGGTIAGTVRWPDGSPAEAIVTLDSDTRAGFSAREGECDATGRFTFTGLGAGSYRVKAEALRFDEEGESSRGKAELASVEPGTEDLALTLADCFALTGRVTDDLGQPVSRFRVRAARASASNRGPFFVDDLSESFREEDGTFTLDGFTSGAWDVVAHGEDHGGSERLRVTIPTSGPVTLVVPRAARVSGVVLDASGNPAEGVQVQVGRNDELSRSVFEVDTSTGADGAFEFEGLAPGSVQLFAQGPGGSPSPLLAIELVAGEELGGLVLQLEGGTLFTGEVVSSGGEPLAGVQVVAVNREKRFREGRETDAQGRFEILYVPAGSLSVWAETDEGLEMRADVTVVEGETAHVRLAAPGQIVLLCGRVLAAGEPGAQTSLFATDPVNGGYAHSRCDSEGAYELRLPGPGRYLLQVNATDPDFFWSTSLDVPAVDVYPYDVVLALGRISGRVIDASGVPVVGIPVRAITENREGGFGYGNAATDDDGRYELAVTPGRVAVSAGGPAPMQPAEYAEARVSGLVVVEGGHLRGIDLALARGGALAGVVRGPDGAGVFQAMLSVEVDGRFQLVGTSQEGGTFRIDGLRPGRLVLRVYSPSGTARVEAEIAAGETRRLDIALVRP